MAGRAEKTACLILDAENEPRSSWTALHLREGCYAGGVFPVSGTKSAKDPCCRRPFRRWKRGATGVSRRNAGGSSNTQRGWRQMQNHSTLTAHHHLSLSPSERRVVMVTIISGSLATGHCPGGWVSGT